MKKEKTPNIVSLAILTLITSILWIFFSLYRVFIEKSDTNVPQEILEPLSPILDETIISEIEKKVFIEQNQIPDTIVTKEIIDETTEQSPSPEPEEKETEATKSANTEILEEI
jgi:hypothetical protein